jgi:uncharacterized protein DUF6600
MIADRKPGRRMAGSILGAALSAILGLTTLAVVPPVPAVAQSDPASLEFREALDVYGSWVPHRRWGDVWVPASVPQGWQPYTNGRWVFTDEWGWYWVSEDPWGWITDHYGRWVFDDGVGWLWIPGDEWAPAWVQWRQGTQQGAQFVGWAPLPPDDVVEEYVDNPDVWMFVPARHLTAPRVRTFLVPRTRRPFFIRETYIVNRTVRLRDRDRERGPRVAVNPGIPAPFIAAAQRRPIRAAEVRPVVLRGTVGVRGAAEIRPDEVRVYRQQLGERRDGRDRRAPRDDRFRVIVRETPTTIRPATVMTPPARLERGEPGRLGDRPPRAAGVPASPQPATVQPSVTQPGTVQPAPGAAPRGPATGRPPGPPATPGVAQPPRRIEDRRPPPTATPVGATPPPATTIQRAPTTAPSAPTVTRPGPAPAAAPPPAAARPAPPQPAAPPPASVSRPAPPPASVSRPAPPPAAPPPAAVQRPAPPAPPPPAAVQRPPPPAAPPPAAVQRPAPQQQPAARPTGQPPRDGERRQRKPGEPEPPR